MAQDNNSIEIKVGALVLVSLILLGGFIFILGDVSFSSGKRLHVRFDNAGGLKPGADVAIAGLQVGQVESLSFVRPEKTDEGEPAVAALATISISAEHADSVREASEFYISTRSVLGENYIEIVTPTRDSPPLEARSTIEGNSPPRTDLLVSKSAELLEALLDLVQNPDVAIDEFVAHSASLVRHLDEFFIDNEQSLDELLTSVRDTASSASKIMSSVQYAVGEGDQLRKTIKNVRATAARSQMVARRLDKTSPKLFERMIQTATNARNVSEGVDQLLENNKSKINSTIDNLEKSTVNWKKLSGGANKLLARIRRGEGTVGQLLTDRKVYDDLREVLRIIKRQPWKIIWKE